VRLTRRDALLAAAGAGTVAVVGVSLGANVGGERAGRESVTDSDVETVVALAEVVYPSEVEATDEFAETYVTELHESRRRGVTAAIDDLDRESRRTHSRDFAAFASGQRATLLRELGVHRSRPIADGTVPERVRFFLVNGLLYALFVTPTGTGLLGIENPLGYPGGYESALRGSR